jgi:aryl-alcohol dehydrogenase-like predicted oxidoreductase
MRIVRIPGTTLDVSRLGFGTGALHHLATAAQRQAILAAALDTGITHFDTAPMYGEGLAERSLGRMLRGSAGRGLTVATKVGFPSKPVGFSSWLMYADKALGVGLRRLRFLGRRVRRRELDSRGVEKSVVMSLRNLCVQHVDMLLIHEPVPQELDAIERLMPLLDRLRAAGTIGLLGMAGQASACATIASALAGAFDVLQVEDSVFGHEADVIIRTGRPLQVTYGYLRLAAAQAGETGINEASAAAVLGDALRRNSAGMVLVSSRNPQRISALAETCRQMTP